MSDPTEPRHPIRVVAERTGLTPATLRAWERRYHVVEPGRSDGGQRLYSDRDVDRLARLHRLTDAGRPIGLVAPLSDEEAEALLREDIQAATTAAASTPAPRSDTGEVVGEALDRIRALDGRGLERTLRRAAVTLGGHGFLEDVVAPLLRGVGSEWVEEKLGIAHEHLCTAVTEDVLAWVSDPAGAGNETGPVLVVATLPGERHGLGARLVAASAALEGWRVTQLGVDLPVGEISDAARALGARAVAVSVVNPALLPQVVRDLAELRQALPPDTAVLVGGGASAALSRKGLHAGVQVVEDLGSLRVALEALVQT